MENAVDALKIAFAVFVFVLAITVTFSVISQAKSTADNVLYYSDETNFYNNLASKEKNRIVSITDVISTLYRYRDELISVTLKLDGEEYIFNSGSETVIKDNGEIDTNNPKLNSEEDKDKNLKNFINKVLLKKYGGIERGTTFKEEFGEAPYSGIYDIGTDGSEITLSSGDKKVYITYYPYLEE